VRRGEMREKEEEADERTMEDHMVRERRKI
jgi:hypothetical protein